MTSRRGEGTNAGRAWEGFSAGNQGGKTARRMLIAATVIAAAAIAFTAFAVLTGGGDPSSAAPGIVAGVTQTPSAAPLMTRTPNDTPTPAPALTDAATDSPTAEPTPATLTPTIDGAWTATPDTRTPTPTAAQSDPVGDLIASIESQYGVRVITDGQDWGADESRQLRNVSAIADALANVPATLRATNNVNAGGTLTFLSNDGGSTEAGWQPYGAREANYYSNEDMVGGKKVAANEVVLQPGSTAQTITHEMMHAYQMRGQAPGDYAGSLLTPEMKSFMQVAGWTQVVTDAQVRADAGSWDSLNADFRYDGRDLGYTNEWGDHVSLYTPNPLEAYAEAGGLYYGHSDHTTLPDWPEYWAWFAANLG